MADLQNVFPAGTEFSANGVPIRLLENLHFELIGVGSYDIAAERCGIGHLHECDWSHEEQVETDKGIQIVNVQYGPQGNRLETLGAFHAFNHPSVSADSPNAFTLGVPSTAAAPAPVSAPIPTEGQIEQSAAIEDSFNGFDDEASEIEASPEPASSPIVEGENEVVVEPEPAKEEKPKKTKGK